MGRRHSDPRPPIEVLGADRPIEPAQRVEIGGAGRGGRLRPLVAVVAAGVLVLGGLALGGDDGSERAGGASEEDRGDEDDRRGPGDEPRTTTTRRPRPTTTSSTTLPLGPLVPNPTGAGLLLVGPGHSASYVDLDTGARSQVDLPGSDLWQLVAAEGGVVGIGPGVEGSTAWYQPLPAGELVPLGPADQVLPAGRPDGVWLLRGRSFEAEAVGQQAALVDLRGRRLGSEVRVTTCCPLSGLDDGVAFSVGGRTYLATPDGIRPLLEGHVLQIGAGRALRLVCDDRAVCRSELVELATARTTKLSSVADPANYGVSVFLSPEGEAAVMTYQERGPTLVLYGADGRELGSSEQPLQGEPVWLPGSNGLVAAVFGDGIARIVPRDGSLVIEPIPTLQRHGADRLLVIR